MPMRNTYDLSHYSFMVGRIGHLMTLSTVPVCAGDSLSVAINGAMRLSPLRRDLSMDAMIDIFGFFVPYRHVYGEIWQDFIRAGYDGGTTIPSGGGTTNRFGVVNVATPMEFLGTPNIVGANVPLWLIAGYNRIWNRYFRIPNGPVGEVADTYLPTLEDARLYGHQCARLRSLPLSGITTDISTADYNVQAAVTPIAGGQAANIDIRQLSLQAAVYRSEVQRSWFDRRYSDIMEEIYGSSVSTDQDERPTLLMRTSDWMSGYDIEGTGDATLGQFAGRSATFIDFSIPKRFYPEHGTLWLMALVRFPTVFEEERHYFLSHPNFSYAQVSGDPTVGTKASPITHTVSDFFDSSATTALGTFPWEQWYRTQPSTVHKRFTHIGGFPFLKGIPGSHALIQYVQPGEYEDVFATTQLGHWRTQLRCSVMADRVVADPMGSIFAGSGIG